MAQIAIFCIGKSLYPLILLAPQVGFEPTAYRLTAERSTTELLGNIKFFVALGSQPYRFNFVSLRTHFVGVQPRTPPLNY